MFSNKLFGVVNKNINSSYLCRLQECVIWFLGQCSTTVYAIEYQWCPQKGGDPKWEE